MADVTRISLQNYRNYHSLNVEVSGKLVALIGDNGSGKTNLLESLSLFAQGRGLRRAEWAAIPRQEARRPQESQDSAANTGFAVSITLQNEQGDVQLGTGLTTGEAARQYRINRAPVSSATAFAEHLRLVWLTPENDGLFRASPGERRRFLDRLVLALDAQHGNRVSNFEKALRSRNKLLEEERFDAEWLDAAERQVAALGVAVTASRLETIAHLQALSALPQNEFAFPEIAFSLEGQVETMLSSMKAAEAEDEYRRQLKQNRFRDKAAGRALIGPQASDLLVENRSKMMPAALCSTGEQKALLVGLILAHCRLVRQMAGQAPLVLLDEIAAHLDERRRQSMYGLLAQLGAQVWMTGTERSAFQGLPEMGQIFQVRAGTIS